VKAASILKGFLNKNPADRLGCHKETGFMEIMTHPFFKSIEWEAVSISGFMTISGLMNISGLIKNFLTLEIHGMSGI